MEEGGCLGMIEQERANATRLSNERTWLEEKLNTLREQFEHQGPEFEALLEQYTMKKQKMRELPAEMEKALIQIGSY